MRDYKRSTGVSSRQLVIRPRLPCAPNDGTASYGSFTSRESARADIVKSDGYHPTKYWAYKREVDASAYDYKRTKYGQCRVYPNPWKRYYTHYVGTTFPGKVQWLLWPGAYADSKTPRISQNLLAEANNRVLANLKNLKMNLSTVAGEMLKEAGALSDILLSIGRALVSIRQKRYKDALRDLGFERGSMHKGLSDGYLAWIFGVMPLVETAQGLHDSIRSALSHPGGLLTCRAQVDDESGVLENYGTFRCEGTMNTGVQIGLTYTIDGANVPPSSRLKTFSELGLTNPLLLAWNLSSLSFVMDWFFSISSFLSGLGAHHGLTFVHGYRTEYGSSTVSCTDNYLADYSGGNYYEGTFPAYSVKEKGHVRHPLFSWPSPGVAFRFDLDSGKLLTLAALTSSLLL